MEYLTEPQLITKSKVFNITSAGNCIKNNGNYNSDITINLPTLINKTENITNIFFSVIHAEIPNSFYLVNSYNNTLIINSITYTIPNGNYNASTLMSTILSVIPSTFTISYNSYNYIYTFTGYSPFTISHLSTINRIIGGDTINDMVSVGRVYTMPNVVNFFGNPRINFRSPQLSFGNFNQYDSSNDLFLSVQNNGVLGSLILYNNFANRRYLYEKDIYNIKTLEIRITDDSNNLLNLNGSDWFLTFEFVIEYVQSPLNNNLHNLLLSQ